MSSCQTVSGTLAAGQQLTDLAVYHPDQVHRSSTHPSVTCWIFDRERTNFWRQLLDTALAQRQNTGRIIIIRALSPTTQPAKSR